ncbi:hypothetical protein Q1695_006556 [Nippostrongylus brasiliensis]|nr:hypothetical protein Q1695_006556 [Nippostrongylus brasiliensis]
MTARIWLAILLCVLSALGLILTGVILVAVVKLAVIKKKSPIYVISAANMSNDLIPMLLASWIVGEGRDHPFAQAIGAVFLFSWYYGSAAQILMALNRLVVVCFPNIGFFTYRNVCIIVFTLYPIAVLVTYVSQYLTPCCRFILDYKYISYSYTEIPGVPNYSNLYIDVPLNSSTSTICAICYIYVFFFVWRMNRLYSNGSSRDAKRLKEYKYALQFFFISIFYLSAWICFRVFPAVMVNSKAEYFVVVSICVTLNCTANAVVYLSSNLEVRGILMPTKTSTVVATVQLSRKSQRSSGVVNTVTQK